MGADRDRPRAYCQSLIVVSPLLVASQWPLGQNAIPRTVSVWPRSSCTRRSLPACQTGAAGLCWECPACQRAQVRSELPLARNSPLGLKVTHNTQSLCPDKMRTVSASSRSGLSCHSRIVLSALPLVRVCPSGLRARDQTHLVWPSRVRSSAPVGTRHSRIVLSQLPLKRVWLSGLKTREKAQSSCPWNWPISFP